MIVAALPAYNEEKSIAKVTIRALRHVDKVLVVDDGSSDATAEIAEKLGAIVIKHERNSGKGEALRTIFNWARTNHADILVTLDADGQHLPEEIPRVLKPVIEGRADICIGSRFVDQASSEMPRHRQWGAKVISGIVGSLSGLSIGDSESGFRAYGRKALSILTPVEMGMGAESSMLLQAGEKGLTITEVPINVAYKDLARHRTRNPVYHALDVLGSVFKYVSIRHPLLFYGLPGLVALGVGFYLGLRALETYSLYREFPTNTGLIAVASSLAGVVLLSTAIMLFTLVTVIRERR